MHRSWHISSFLLILINVILGSLALIHNFNPAVLYSWGAVTGHQPAVQSLSEFPPFFLFHIHQGLLTKALTGTSLTLMRAFYASFLHFSLIHLASNMYALYALGWMFDDLNYPGILIPLYIVCGIVSMLAAAHFNPTVLTCGASGAIFGLMGAMITSAIKAKIEVKLNKKDPQTALNYMNVSGVVYSAVAINLIATFTTPGISIPGHVFGFIAGLILGFLIPIREAS